MFRRPGTLRSPGWRSSDTGSSGDAECQWSVSSDSLGSSRGLKILELQEIQEFKRRLRSRIPEVSGGPMGSGCSGGFLCSGESGGPGGSENGVQEGYGIQDAQRAQKVKGVQEVHDMYQEIQEVFKRL